MTSVTTQPRYLNARTNIYNAWDLRKDNLEGAGVYAYEDFRVLQTQSGATMGVDIGKTAVGLMKANVRGGTREGQGLYCVDNVDPAVPLSAGFLAQLNVSVTANASGNPRLDQIVLQVEDSQHAGSNNLASVVCLPGTPSAPVTIDNRTGAAALPASCILLADVIVASGAATIVTANIRDRRAFYAEGVIPPVLTAVDQVAFQPPAGVQLAQQACCAQASFDQFQAAALMYLPRRIVGATRIRWKYGQFTTANAQNYIIAIADASGRFIPNATTGVQAYLGAANSFTVRSETITATTFERGWYYVFIGNSPATAGAIVNSYGVIGSLSSASQQVGPMQPNLYLRATGGSTTLPATILALTDVSTLVANAVLPTVPMITLSVG